MINSYLDIIEQENFFPTYIASLIKSYILSQDILWEFQNQSTYNTNVYRNIIDNFDKNLPLS